MVKFRADLTESFVYNINNLRFLALLALLFLFSLLRLTNVMLRIVSVSFLTAVFLKLLHADTLGGSFFPLYSVKKQLCYVSC